MHLLLRAPLDLVPRTSGCYHACLRCACRCKRALDVFLPRAGGSSRATCHFDVCVLLQSRSLDRWAVSIALHVLINAFVVASACASVFDQIGRPIAQLLSLLDVVASARKKCLPRRAVPIASLCCRCAVVTSARWVFSSPSLLRPLVRSLKGLRN